MTGKSLMKQQNNKNQSNLKLEDITDENYIYPKRACKDFEINSLGEYHDLYLKSDILLLANVLESFKKTCLEIYELDPVKFISAPGIA